MKTKIHNQLSKYTRDTEYPGFHFSFRFNGNFIFINNMGTHITYDGYDGRIFCCLFASHCRSAGRLCFTCMYASKFDHNPDKVVWKEVKGK